MIRSSQTTSRQLTIHVSRSSKFVGEQEEMLTQRFLNLLSQQFGRWPLYRITVSYVIPLALIWTLNIPTQHSSLTLPVLPIWRPQLTQQRCPSAQQFVEVASSEGHFPHRSPPKGRPTQPSSGRILKCVNTDSPFQFTRLSERAALVW